MFRRCNNARNSVRRYGSHQMITAQLISSRRSSLFCPPQPQYMRIARNHSGLGAFLFKFHLLRLRRLSSHQIGYPFHARRLIWTSPMQQAGGCSVFPRCTFRKEMVIYTHRSIDVAECVLKLFYNKPFLTLKLDTIRPRVSRHFQVMATQNTWGVALHQVRLLFLKWHLSCPNLLLPKGQIYEKIRSRQSTTSFLPTEEYNERTFYFFVRSSEQRLEVTTN